MPARANPPRPRRSRARDEEILRSAAEDASRLLFSSESVPIVAPASEPAVGIAPDPTQPHYHNHRERLREKFEKTGPGALHDYEVLELLLFRVIPRRDTKPLAKALLERFHDLAGVLGASAPQIASVRGAGRSVALELKVVHAALERAARVETQRRQLISSWSQLIQYCRIAMANAPREQLRVLFLDVKNQLVSDEILSEGTIDHAPVYPREIARRALELGASAVILVHNHPSGDPKPSKADVDITRDVQAAAKAIGVKVHDHLVIGRNGQESLKSLGLM